MTRDMSEKCTQISDSLMEKVASNVLAALHGYAGITLSSDDAAHVAKTALEASGHAKLVEALRVSTVHLEGALSAWEELDRQTIGRDGKNAALRAEIERNHELLSKYLRKRGQNTGPVNSNIGEER